MKVLQNSGIPQDFESGILHKLLLSFLEILKFLGTQFSVVNVGGGGGGRVDIFWNGPLGEVFYIFFSFRNLLKHVMCQINYDAYDSYHSFYECKMLKCLTFSRHDNTVKYHLVLN